MITQENFVVPPSPVHKVTGATGGGRSTRVRRLREQCLAWGGDAESYAGAIRRHAGEEADEEVPLYVTLTLYSNPNPTPNPNPNPNPNYIFLTLCKV